MQGSFFKGKPIVSKAGTPVKTEPVPVKSPPVLVRWFTETEGWCRLGLEDMFVGLCTTAVAEGTCQHWRAAP